MGDVIGRFSSTTLAGEPLTVPDGLSGPTLLVDAAGRIRLRARGRATPDGVTSLTAVIEPPD